MSSLGERGGDTLARAGIGSTLQSLTLCVSSNPPLPAPLQHIRRDMLKKKCARFFDPLDWPTQVLVNEYRNNQGIASHFEDFDSFGDIILTISLINPLYM